LVSENCRTFHLDPAKVQAVFDQNRTDRQAQAETTYEDRLNQAVTDGKLTADQKSAVLAEHNQLKSELDTAMQKTGADRRTALDQVRTEAKAWARLTTSTPSGCSWAPAARHGPDGTPPQCYRRRCQSFADRQPRSVRQLVQPFARRHLLLPLLTTRSQKFCPIRHPVGLFGCPGCIDSLMDIKFPMSFHFSAWESHI